LFFSFLFRFFPLFGASTEGASGGRVHHNSPPFPPPLRPRRGRGGTPRPPAGCLNPCQTPGGGPPGGRHRTIGCDLPCGGRERDPTPGGPPSCRREGCRGRVHRHGWGPPGGAPEACRAESCPGRARRRGPGGLWPSAGPLVDGQPSGEGGEVHLGPKLTGCFRPAPKRSGVGRGQMLWLLLRFASCYETNGWDFLFLPHGSRTPGR